MKLSPPLKGSIAATAVILIAGIWMVRQNQVLLESLKQQPTTPGKTTGAGQETISRSSKTKHQTTVKPKAPKVEISMVTAVAAESIASRAQGRMKSDEENQRQRDLSDRINALDAGQLEEFVNEVAACQQLPSDEMRWWISKGLQTLGRSDVDKALDLLASDHLAIMKGSDMASVAVAMIIEQITVTNPDKAFAKLDACAQKLPWLDLKQINSMLVQSVARSNTDTALRLLESRIEPFGPQQVRQCLNTMTVGCSTGEQSLAVVSYMNGYFTRMKEPAIQKQIQAEIMIHVGSQLAKEGYDATQQWLETAKLSREQSLELENYAAVNSQGTEVGKWLEWVGRETPFQSVAEKDQSKWCYHVRSIAGNWVRKDTVAFSKWLETSKPDEVRNMCIVEFAHSIAEDHPETAADWVKQITYEDTRQFMLKEVYRKAEFSNAGEREAFARKYGIK